MGKYKDPNYKHKWYLKNQEKIKNKRLERYYLNRDFELKQNKKYRKGNPLVKKLRIKESKNYRGKYPEKIRAQKLSQNIKIPKNQKCNRCKERLARHKHHPNYDKPLEVEFLCIKCHNGIHNPRDKNILCGMFDTVGTVLACPFCFKLQEPNDFQTKDMACSLDSWTINEIRTFNDKPVRIYHRCRDCGVWINLVIEPFSDEERHNKSTEKMK